MSSKTLSLLLLFILFASFGSFHVDDFHTSRALDSTSNSLSNVEDIRSLENGRQGFKQTSKINDGNLIEFTEYSTQAKTNKSEYRPGDVVEINTTSNSQLGINGSVSWSLKSPLNENAVSFSNDASSVFFDDPELKNNSVIDWNNVNFADVSTFQLIQEVWLNITTADATKNASLSYNRYNDIEGKFDLSFEYKMDFSDNNANLTFSYWNGSQWNSVELQNKTTPTLFSLTGIFLNSKTMPSSLFKFNLNMSKASWNIKALKILYDYDNIQLLDKNGLPDQTEKSDVLENIWVHGPQSQFRDIISVNYHVLSSSSNSYANFVFSLPDNNLYFGDWQFTIIVNPFNDSSTNLPSHNFVIPVRITEDLFFNVSKEYVYRGINSTTNNPIFNDETGITNVFSPTDNISLVGKLASVNDQSLDDAYFTNVTGYVLLNSTGVANLDLVWGKQADSSLVGFNGGNSIYDTVIKNKLPSGINNSQYWLMNYNVPNRGLYGDVNRSLFLTFPSLIKFNDTNNQTISDDYVLKVPLDPIKVKFDLNVSTTLDNLPFDRTWYLTEVMEGSFSVNTWRYDTDALITGPAGSTYNWQLSFPLSDLDLSIGLNDNVSEGFNQLFNLNLFNGKFYFSGSLDPNLKTNVNYFLQLKWNTPKEDKLTNIKLLSGNSLAYLISGTFTVQLPNELIVIHVGKSASITFNISLDQLNNKLVHGLKLKAEISNVSLPLNIIEKNGHYEILVSIPDNFQSGKYNLIISNDGEQIGTLELEILPSAINNQDVKIAVPDLYTYIGLAMVLVALLGFFAGIKKYT